LDAVHPTKCIAIRDDRHVIEIVARKVPSKNGERWYRVVLEGR
jgi:hypothetical protein